MFFERLNKLVDDLIINLQPDKSSFMGEKSEPFNEDARQLSWAIWSAMRASRLYTLNPAMSVQNRFTGKLKRQKDDIYYEATSLGLFRDDIECLLRDLYGDAENTELEDVLNSISNIILVFTRYVRKDLWQEKEYARAWDCYASGDDSYHAAASEAYTEFEVSVREVLENPPPLVSIRSSMQKG